MCVESATENYWRQFASATYSDSSKLPYVKVIYDEPVSIEINPEAMRLYVGETYRANCQRGACGGCIGDGLLFKQQYKRGNSEQYYRVDKGCILRDGCGNGSNKYRSRNGNRHMLGISIYSY